MMMKTTQTLLAVAFLLLANVLSAIQEYDIRFTLASSDCDAQQVCYQTEIRSADGQSWNLAGQNYRIYYDASMARYIDGSVKRTDNLDPNQYSDILFAGHFFNQDASGSPGDLPFMETLSFLNYSIDLMNLTNGGTNLPADGEWVETTELCFDVTEELLMNPSECLGLVWARMGRTDGIATAFVEVSQWVEANSTTEAFAREYNDLDAEDGDASCLTPICCPECGDAENTGPLCTDGIDNDEDGLIDCDDSDCSEVTECELPGKPFQLSLTLKEVNCTTGMACYNVNLTASRDQSFLLGNQRYQLYYNSAVGSFVSGTSQLGSDFQQLSLQQSTPLENINATGVGDLPFESDLGFINFRIQLSDDQVGSTMSISTDTTIVAELCFAMTNLVINEADICFESTWARPGVTDPYNASMVSIEEWVEAGVSVEAVGTVYGDLTPNSGDDACFNLSCPEGQNEFGDEQCGDGIDNDDDGLIDCFDSGCISSGRCPFTCNAQAPVLSTLNSSATDLSCDYPAGPVRLGISGGNLTDLYTTVYVLVDLDKSIIQINGSAPEFDVTAVGFYAAYAINFDNDTDVSGISIGANVEEITASDDCFDISNAYGFTVCADVVVCNYCLGEEINLDPSGADPDPGFTKQYVLTDNNGLIVSIVSQPSWTDLEAGTYLSFPVIFETSKDVVGLDTTQNITSIESGCLDISEPTIIGICDNLNPTILFDLKGCDITRTAVLVVGEEFSSYLWSTGSTEPFIEVSATEPATYRVTVALDDGCIGVKEQRITGGEIARIGDFVWEDKNGNGRQNAEDTGFNGVTVNLHTDFDRNGLPDFPEFPSCTTTTTNHPVTGEPGWYEFTLYQSSYIIEVISPSGFTPTVQDQGDDARDSDIDQNGLSGSIAMTPGQVVNTIDAGFRTSTGVGGIVWVDMDGDGRRDPEEAGIDDITLNLYSADGELTATTLSLTDATSGAGTYCFDDITVRDYYVELVLPDGRSFSEPNVGTDDTRDSDATGAFGFGTTDVVSTSPGVKTLNVDFGIYTGAVVCGLIWKEQVPGTENIYDEGTDSIVANSQVELINADTEEVILIGVTGEDGTYCIEGIPVGSYKLAFRASRDGEVFVQPQQGDDNLLDSDVDMNTGMTGVFFASPEDSLKGVNAGLRLEALPIELVSFTGYWDEENGANILNWVTASEINNDHIDVERVIDNNGTFEAVGSVKGNGTTTEISTYSYTDDVIDHSGIYYYRLKQVDYDGGYEYSDIISIDVALNSNVGLVAYPNPISDKVMLDFTVGQRDQAEVTISDLMGRTIMSPSIHYLDVGQNTIEIPCESLVNGTYMVIVNIGSTQQYKLIQVAR